MFKQNSNGMEWNGMFYWKFVISDFLASPLVIISYSVKNKEVVYAPDNIKQNMLHNGIFKSPKV